MFSTPSAFKGLLQSTACISSPRKMLPIFLTYPIMHFTQQLAMAAALASVTSALPHTFVQKRADNTTKTTFQVQQKLQGPADRKLAGPVAMARAIGKYAKVGAKVPEVVQSAANKAAQSDDGTVVANPAQYDSEYIESVSIGGQTLNLDFDTGSSDLWVFSSELPAADQQGHNVYTPGSSAQLLNGETWSITYGDQSSASGNVYADTVNVGGTTVTAQAVEAAQTISSEFVQGGNDGLLGLGFSSINTVTPDQQKTFFTNAESLLDAPLFTANLKKGAPGNYNFGYIDNSEYTGTIAYVPVDNSQGFWGYTTSGYAVGSGKTVTSSIQSIADTGTTLLLIDDSVVTAYYKQVKGSSNSQTDGGYVFPCSATLPDLSFTIGSYTGTIPGSYINYAPASANGQCFGGVQSNAGIGFNIFGDIWLKSQFVVFDDAAGGPQIGYAAKAT